MSLILPVNGIFEEPPFAKKFTFEAQSRIRYHVRKEKRGANRYWYLRKKIGRKQHSVYLAPQGKLELAMLENAAKLIESRAEQKTAVKKAQLPMPFMKGAAVQS